MFCQNCDYDLRGSANCICPECGGPFDPADLTTYRRRNRDARDTAQTCILALIIPLPLCIAATVLAGVVVGAPMSLENVCLSTATGAVLGLGIGSGLAVVALGKPKEKRPVIIIGGSVLGAVVGGQFLYLAVNWLMHA